MPPRPQTHQPCHTWELRELINQEISNELHSRNQSVLPTMNKSDTVTALVLGLDVQTLSSSSYTEQTRKELIDLAKRAPVLLTYPAGKDRQEALLAIWRLLRQRSQTDNNNDDNNNQNHNKPNNPPPPSLFFETQQPTPFDFSQPPHPHFLTTTVREMHPLPGPRGYVPVSYIDPHVVPLVDYWPGFVREGFRAGSWRFGVEGGLEVMEGRLDLLEWLIEMEEGWVRRGRGAGGAAFWRVSAGGDGDGDGVGGIVGGVEGLRVGG